jgi:hypothetical protein
MDCGEEEEKRRSYADLSTRCMRNRAGELIVVGRREIYDPLEMNRRVLLGMVAGLAMLVGCTQFFQSSLTGRWEGTARLSFAYVESYEVVLEIVETKGVLTGTFECVYDFGSDVAEIIGTHAGKNVEISLVFKGLEMVLVGVAERRAIAGTCTWRGVTDTWEVSRMR